MELLNGRASATEGKWKLFLTIDHLKGWESIQDCKTYNDESCRTDDNIEGQSLSYKKLECFLITTPKKKKKITTIFCNNPIFHYGLDIIYP